MISKLDVILRGSCFCEYYMFPLLSKFYSPYQHPYKFTNIHFTKVYITHEGSEQNGSTLLYLIILLMRAKYFGPA